MPPSPPAAVQEDEEEYVMERIVGKRRDSKGNIEYRVRWEGYASDEDTWEKASKLRGYAILNEYQAELRRERQSRSPAASTATPRLTSKKATPKSTPRNGVSKPKEKEKEKEREGKKEATKKKKIQGEKQAGSSFTSANFTEGDDAEYEEEEIENVPVAGVNAINQPEVIGESLEEPFVGKKYRVQQGVGVLRMLGVKKSPVAGIGSVVLVQYEDKSYELVPSLVLVEKCPKVVDASMMCRCYQRTQFQKLIAYYESHLGFS